jgi:threonine/homoserine/homoserine lactone efflux protein
MEFLPFMASVFLISLSGVMSPGPLFAVTMAEGKSNKFAGFFITLGHAAVEIPIIIALFLFGSVVISNDIKAAIGLVGGMVLLYFAYREYHSDDSARPTKGVISGIIMSSINPYFLIWWLTIGFHLVLQSITFGVLGLVAFIVIHEFCDLAWLGFVSVMSNRSALTLGKRAERTLTIISVSILVVFGAYFAYDGLTHFI